MLVIYMQDSPQRCLERIQKRNRPYEQKIELQYLKTLGADYETLLADWRTCPVIRVSVSQLDCTKNANIDNLLNQIKSYIAV